MSMIILCLVKRCLEVEGGMSLDYGLSSLYAVEFVAYF